MPELGVSFSLHRCAELGVDKKSCLRAAISELGFRRFRLMSYWNIHEQTRGHYNFSELDWQIDMIAKAEGTVTMCLGMRQPRWPEFHVPEWAQKLTVAERNDALAKYISVVIDRYKNRDVVISWQLENEALLQSFGDNRLGDFDRSRLRREFKLVKSLDNTRPVIMTLSDSWGLPWRRPKPDMFAMSMYRITRNKQGEIVHSKRPALFYRLRRWLILVLRWRRTFIHEMQAEPWFDRAIGEVPIKDQLSQMPVLQIQKTIAYAQRTGAKTVDLWGLEWWYWLKVRKNEPALWDGMVKNGTV